MDNLNRPGTAGGELFGVPVSFDRDDGFGCVARSLLRLSQSATAS